MRRIWTALNHSLRKTAPALHHVLNSSLQRLRVHPRLPPKQYLTPEIETAYYSIISADPPIFYVAYWMDEQLRFNASFDLLFEYLKHKNAWFLYTWYWHIEDPERIAIARQYEEAHRQRYPGHTFIHLCNTEAQQNAFSAQGLRAVFCNHNSLVDERIFYPMPGIGKRFDAVYDARLKNYKRHELCDALDSLALIYAFDTHVDDPAQVDDLRHQLRHAHYFNHADGRYDGAYRQMTAEDVARCLNQCRVGLCLSAVEGAMYASIQYLLCGLPVVSTPSLGGRDVFFDKENSLIVQPTPEAVRDGVQEMLDRNPDPACIRERTLARMRRHREVFIDVVQRIYSESGCPHRDFAREWPHLFFNKMLRFQRHKDTIAQLDRTDSSAQ